MACNERKVLPVLVHGGVLFHGGLPGRVKASVSSINRLLHWLSDFAGGGGGYSTWEVV